ncbi:hypothetical protein VE00_03803 [Pseudogymnoascus sp. WSF 3629]|nr:hypothetical protein VE00_03803 [Pseudogymnoascus sp. WSF 3629]
MGSLGTSNTFTVGVLALQGAFNEHTQLLRSAAQFHPATLFTFIEVRTAAQLASCDALVIPGGESTTISLIAERCNLLEPLRDFVKVQRKPTWGTCAGLILLAESANRTKAGGQELIGGLDVRVNRNHFGRQTESFQADLDLKFLGAEGGKADPFRAIFIRAPIVETLLKASDGAQEGEAQKPETVIAPSKDVAEGIDPSIKQQPVEILGTVQGRTAAVKREDGATDSEAGDIVAVRQGNVFGTSFHPELTGDARIHAWWLGEAVRTLEGRKSS